jgi:hypothetical protein
VPDVLELEWVDGSTCEMQRVRQGKIRRISLQNN